MSSQDAPPPLLDLLSARLLAPVDAPAQRRAALLVLDWLGCALGARRLPLAAQLRTVCAQQAAGPCSSLGAGRREPGAALLLNAALGNGLEMDDVDRGAILHPGPVVIPVALAAAQLRGADAGALLAAVVRGYEATIRIGRSLGRGHYRYWHPTSTAGAFGAAVAAASVFGLDASALADAMGTAGSRTGGLWQMRHEPVPTKSLHNSEAARSGLIAALLAQAGIPGPRRVLEGPQGLYAATAPDAAPELILRDAPDWLIHTTSLKPWAACRHAHPAIDALRLLRPFDPVRVAAIEVATYGEALQFCDRLEPATEAEARFSLQHALASVALHGDPAPHHFSAAALHGSGLAALRAKVRLRLDPALDAAFPRHYGARVRLTMLDGSVREQTCLDAWGDPEWPMLESDVRSKAHALAAWGGVPADAAGLGFDAALALADGGGLDTFVAAFDALGQCADDEGEGCAPDQARIAAR